MTLAVARQKTSDIAVAGEFPFTWEDFAAVAAMMYEISGIHLIEAKATLVYSRLAKRLRVLGLPDFAAYRAFLEQPEAADERSAMLSALTTNVTRFYREPHHFTDLSEKRMPALAAAARGGARVRLWSAGCSAGHEPYTLAMTVLEALPEAASLDFRILASDIDPLIVQRAAAGRYSSDDIEPVPPALRSRHLVRANDGWSVSPALRSLITFRTLNLLADWPMRGQFDVIFCRNVAIYFDDPTQARLFGRFADALKDGGHLYIGHSERANVPGLTPDGLTAYRREARRA